MFPSPAQVHQVIAVARHGSWFIEKCLGVDCPRRGPRACKHAVAWRDVCQELRASIRQSLQSWLTQVSATRWCSCVGKHGWPNASTAPLIYMPHTSARQAKILLHFGLCQDSDVSLLIRKDYLVALLVAHLLHHPVGSAPFAAVLAILDSHICR